MAEQSIIIADTSVLINFLVLDKLATLTSLAATRFLITDHVRAEVTVHYPEQLDRLTQAISSRAVEEISVTDIAEVQLFGELTKTGLGAGECSAIAVAMHRKHSLAIDDKTARKRVARLDPAVLILSTELLMIELIQQSRLTVAEADRMKDEWEVHHRFRLPFGSFSEKV